MGERVDIERLRVLLAKASPEPWTLKWERDWDDSKVYAVHDAGGEPLFGSQRYYPWEEDMPVLVDIRNAAPSILDELEAAREQIAAMAPPPNGGSHWDGCWQARDHHACAVALIRELVGAGTALRAAQRAYLADRGNESLGKKVGVAAAELDTVLTKAEEVLR